MIYGPTNQQIPMRIQSDYGVIRRLLDLVSDLDNYNRKYTKYQKVCLTFYIFNGSKITPKRRSDFDNGYRGGIPSCRMCKSFLYVRCQHPTSLTYLSFHSRKK